MDVAPRCFNWDWMKLDILGLDGVKSTFKEIQLRWLGEKFKSVSCM